MKMLVTAAFLIASVTATATAAFAAPVPHLSEKLDKIFGRLDANRDGFISRAEADAGKKMARHFGKVDANNDGFVSRDEMAAALQRRHDRKEAKRDEECKRRAK